MRIGSISWNRPFKRFLLLNIALQVIPLMILNVLSYPFGGFSEGDLLNSSFFLGELFFLFITVLCSVNAWIFSEHRWGALARTTLLFILLVFVAILLFCFIVGADGLALFVFVVYAVIYFIIILIFTSLGYYICRNSYEEIVSVDE